MKVKIILLSFLVNVVIFSGPPVKAFTGQQVMKGKKGDKWPYNARINFRNSW
jgi:hypothetical protein